MAKKLLSEIEDSLKTMRKFNLQNVVWKEGQCYVSWNLNTGVSSFADTKKEALESLDEALELYYALPKTTSPKFI